MAFLVDGQRLNFGDYDTDFPIYSCGLPLLYSFVADEIGLKNVCLYFLFFSFFYLLGS